MSLNTLPRDGALQLGAARPVPADSAGSRRAEFLAAYPGYLTTTPLDCLRSSEYSYLDADGHIYLDYAGAGLPAQAQLRAHAIRLGTNCFGDSPSPHPGSDGATDLVEEARLAVLDHFSAPHYEYAVIFTPNASAACRLVGQAYPFGHRRRLVLTSDNHSSVGGIAECAQARGAATEYVPFTSPDLRISDDAVRAALQPTATEGGLLAFPAQSNFSGVRHNLRWIEISHELGYQVLLDAAAYVPSNRLDLSLVKPDFVAVSWCKALGYPTGVGCLVARRKALAALEQPRLKDGTPNALHVPDVTFGLSWVNRIGLEVIHGRVTCLTGWLLHRLTAMRHSNGQPMTRIYGPEENVRRGGTIAFGLLDQAGDPVEARAIARDAAAAGISVRTSGFCNPGACETAPEAVRASVGLASNVDDIEAFVSLLRQSYRDRSQFIPNLGK